MSRPRPRNVRIGKRRTSMRLENEFWDALSRMAQRQNTTVAAICTSVHRRRNGLGLSAAVRVKVLQYFRRCAEQCRTRRA